MKCVQLSSVDRRNSQKRIITRNRTSEINKEQKNQKSKIFDATISNRRKILFSIEGSKSESVKPGRFYSAKSIFATFLILKNKMG